MLLDADQYGPAAAILCVSNDQGFAETLACCGQFGALTVAGEPGSCWLEGRGPSVWHSQHVGGPQLAS